MCRSAILAAGVISVLVLLVAAAGPATAQFPYVCGDAVTYFGPCLDFIRGLRTDRPGQKCCDGVATLNSIAHWEGRQPERICRCIEFMSAGLDPPYSAYWIEQLPHKCHTGLSFPISASMDCSKLG